MTHRSDGSQGDSSEVHNRAGQCPGDAGDALHPCDNEFAQLIDGVRLGTDDHVIGSGNVLGAGDPREFGNRLGDRGGLADLCLDEDERLHHDVPLSVTRDEFAARAYWPSGPSTDHPGIRFG